jgi:hypothetical protein
MFWSNLYSVGIFWKFLVTTPSAEMTMGYTDMLLSFQIFFNSRVKSSYFVIIFIVIEIIIIIISVSYVA